MTKGYVFKAGGQTAISNAQDGSNLPAPKAGNSGFRGYTLPGNKRR
jgi:hypothetical protein